MNSIYAKKLEHLFEIWDQSEYENDLISFTDTSSKFAIYGAGIFGAKMRSVLKDHFGVSPLAFIDRKAEKGNYYIDDIPVYTPHELFNIAGNANIGVALKSYYTGEEKKQIDDTLRMIGFSNIRSIWTPDAYSNEFLYSKQIDRSKIICAIDVLHDKASKEQYFTYVYSRLWKTPFFAPTYPSNSSNSETDLFWLDEKDHVLDCGAYDGDTARKMLSNYPNLQNITMFEPDNVSFCRLTNWMQGVSNKNLCAIQKSVSNQNGRIGFLSIGTVASRIDENTENKVESCRIDDLVFKVPPSFIKLDVEGAELDVLHGAKKTILKNRPILSVSCYHKAADVYEIPLFIKELQPSYMLFYRKYCSMYNTHSFNLLAIPPERLL